MGKYGNIAPLLLAVKTKEAQLRAEETEYARILGRLEGLEPSVEVRALFQRFVNRELTIKQLDTAIDRFLHRKAFSRQPPT